MTVIALLHTAAFVWAWLQLRPRAADTARRRARAAPRPIDAAPGRRRRRPPCRPAVARRRRTAGRRVPAAAAPGAPAVVTMPTWTEPAPFAEVGLTGWVGDRLRASPVRADRSASLRNERRRPPRPARRLDPRRALPRDARHAHVPPRRAVPDALRRGLPRPDRDRVPAGAGATANRTTSTSGPTRTSPSTRWPAGSCCGASDHVKATAELGVPVRAAALEARRDEGTAEAAGGRLHVATGDGHPHLRPADPAERRSDAGARRRARWPSIRPSRAWSWARTTARSRCSTSPTLGTDGAGEAEPVFLMSVDHPVRHLLVTDDGTIVAASDLDVTAIDGSTGEILGSAEFEGIAGLANGGTGPVLQGDPAAIADPVAVASVLVELIGGDALDYESRITGRRSRHRGPVRQPGHRRDADGRRGGHRRRSPAGDGDRRPAARRGRHVGRGHVHRPGDGDTSTTLPLEGGAHGLALVTGLDDPRLYVTSGTAETPTYHVDRGRRRRRGGRTRSTAATNRCPASARGSPTTTRPSRSTSWAWRPGQPGPPGDRPLDGLRRRAARERGLRRRAAARRVRPGGVGRWTSSPSTRPRTASSCSCSAATGRPP